MKKVSSYSSNMGPQSETRPLSVTGWRRGGVLGQSNASSCEFPCELPTLPGTKQLDYNTKGFWYNLTEPWS